MKTFSGKQDLESLQCQRPSVKELLMTHLRKKQTEMEQDATINSEERNKKNRAESK